MSSALDGKAQQVVARRLKLRMAEVRELLDDLEAVGVYIQYVETTSDLCPQCAAHYATEETGFCVRCTTKNEVEAEALALAEEEERLRAEAVKAKNNSKQERKRLRELYDANPRTKTLRKWVEWMAEDPDRLDTVVAAVNEKREEAMRGEM